MALARDLQWALDPARFAREALGFTPDPWQEGVLRWDGRRMLLNCSRQSGKSTVTAARALHRAIFYPDSLILLVSPTLRQSGELFRKISEHMAKLAEKPAMEEDNKLSLTLANGSRIVSLPAKEANVRGFSGAALIVEDEASRVPDSLYFSMRPMLAVSGGSIILLSTPFGKRGHFFDEWTGDGDWERVAVKASDCPRISKEFLREERAALGDLWWRQEYNTEFLETVDSVFGYDDVVGAFTDDVEPLFPQRIRQDSIITEEVQPL